LVVMSPAQLAQIIRATRRKYGGGDKGPHRKQEEEKVSLSHGINYEGLMMPDVQ
jgi:hypothetical protein